MRVVIGRDADGLLLLDGLLKFVVICIRVERQDGAGHLCFGDAFFLRAPNGALVHSWTCEGSAHRSPNENGKTARAPVGVEPRAEAGG